MQGPLARLQARHGLAAARAGRVPRACRRGSTSSSGPASSAADGTIEIRAASGRPLPLAGQDQRPQGRLPDRYRRHRNRDLGRAGRRTRAASRRQGALADRRRPRRRQLVRRRYRAAAAASRAERLRVVALPGLGDRPLLGMDVLGRLRWSQAARRAGDRSRPAVAPLDPHRRRVDNRCERDAQWPETMRNDNTRQETPMTDANSFTKLVPGFDFLQGLVKNAGAALPGIGQWVAPTLNPEELDKRIEELRTVQFWLEQNARMLGATIQALEVQRMTLVDAEDDERADERPARFAARSSCPSDGRAAAEPRQDRSPARTRRPGAPRNEPRRSGRRTGGRPDAVVGRADQAVHRTGDHRDAGKRRQGPGRGDGPAAASRRRTTRPAAPQAGGCGKKEPARKTTPAPQAQPAANEPPAPVGRPRTDGSCRPASIR